MADKAGGQDPDAPDRTVQHPAENGRRVLSAGALFGEAREVEIHHGDAVYRLRLTRAGKLILTK